MAPNDMSRMRISDAERDQVAEILREAAGEGRLDLDELDERLNAVYAAKTYADLEPIVADLPTGATGPIVGTSPAVPTHGAVVGGGPPLVLQAKGQPMVRKGEWTVPHRIEVDGRFGSIRLDFREALISTPVVEVHLDASWGGADLILPETATAEVDVDSSWFGSLRSDVDSIRRAGVTHFVITGACQGGSLRVRHKSAKGWGGLFG
ncbi:DUF1707 SHOCT-like domain-containing protein [Nocardiopsis sp. LDBS1602]|uniref:DUF1707 SHOCT-like domain-containing protein n=1 Tax=Nocardiopsis sp. LDBS1602 TaxID=3109597 RepID=UPI002DBA49BF|nr:DUF1707 domain-containing protein [Nocardiopsis sp. LDBS1602]MEC3894268.1 DUF1707 domain-containing protein [Nocardiopsis sp. LDBS1602]